MFKNLFLIILGLFCIAPAASGVGRFDSIDGTYDANTSLGFFKQMFYQMRTRSLIADLARTVGGESQVDAFSGPSLNSIIKRVKISSGDMLRFTLEENVNGMPTYGDKPVVGGGFLQFKNMEARVNNIDSPAIQIVGKMSQQRVRESIENLPAETRRQVIDYMAEQLEFEAIPALLQGASPACLKTTANGGLGVSLGTGTGAGAGVQLCNKHWYTPDTGFCTYSTTPATWNSTVNDAINGIDAALADQFSLAVHSIIRSKLDDETWSPVELGGKRYKAIAGCDPDIMWRLRALMDASMNLYGRERGKSNPIFNVDYAIELDDILYFSWRNLKKYRPAYNASAATPDFGPVTADSDPRTYSTSQTNGLVIYMGANALVEGYNDEIVTTEETARHKKAVEVAAHMMEGFIRGEWYAKDGRTDTAAVENRSVLTAAFYEPGVGSTGS